MYDVLDVMNDSEWITSREIGDLICTKKNLHKLFFPWGDLRSILHALQTQDFIKARYRGDVNGCGISDCTEYRQLEFVLVKKIG